MTTIRLDIPEERLKFLTQRAQALGMTTEDLIRLSIAELIMRPASDVQQGAVPCIAWVEPPPKPTSV